MTVKRWCKSERSDFSVKNGKYYITAQELSIVLGCSLSSAYRIIHQMNEELAKKGFLTLQGKVSRAFVAEKFHGFSA